MDNCLVLQKKAVTLKEDDVLRKPKILIKQRIDEQTAIAFNPSRILPNPLLEGGPIVLGQLNQRILDVATGKTVREAGSLFKDITETEFESRILTLVSKGLLLLGEEADPDFDSISNSLRTVKAYKMITNWCNKTCPGCYMGKRGYLPMTWEILKKSFDTVMLNAERRGFGKVKIFIFGGETLREWEKIKRLLNYAGKKYGEKIDSNNLQFMLATNGILLSKNMFEYLAQYKVMTLVSIGDIMNPDANIEENTRRWDNLLAAYEDLRGRAAVVAMLTASMENLPQLPFVLQKFLDNGMRGIRISLWKFSAFDDAPSPGFIEAYTEKSIKYIGECFDMLENFLLKKKVSPQMSQTYFQGYDYLLDSMALRYPKRTICGAGRTLFLIDQLGRVCSCQLSINKPLGILDDNVFDLVEKQNLDKSCFELHGCRDCDFRFTCVGHCQKSVQNATGNFGPSIHCQIYKTLIPKWIKLQGIFVAKHQLSQFIG